ncbi:MAG TPA: 50S ribosomal protein L24 [Abditibacteriaceae bacterium]|jgi:large subunit ribosomal protein L24
MAHSKRGKVVNRKPLHINTNDEVVILSGASKGKTGKVLSVDPRQSKVVVEGVNIVKDRQRNAGGDGRASTVGQNQVVDKPMPIHRSKVALIDPTTKKATRVKMVTGKDGKRVRATKTGEVL